MNWNGGAFARANLKRQLNDNRQNNCRNFVGPHGHDENEGERREGGTAPNANSGGVQGGIPKRTRKKKISYPSHITKVNYNNNCRNNLSHGIAGLGLAVNGSLTCAAPNDRALDSHLIGRQHQDYAAMGFELLKPQKYERRVVPLLEFLEKKFPTGHILSLQLNHQMDITRDPNASLDASSQAASTSRDDTANTSVVHREGQSHDNSGISGVTINANATMNSSQSSILCHGSINSQSPSGIIGARGGNAGGSGGRTTQIFKVPSVPSASRLNVGAQTIQEGGINLEKV